MRLKGKIKARCKGYSKRETAKRKKDGLTANVDYDIVLTAAQAKKVFGPEYADFCFSDTFVDGDVVIHRFAKKTPSSDFKPEKHAITVGELEVVTKPRLGDVYPVADAQKVLIKMTLPVYVGPGSLIGAALDLAGEDVELAFTETQQPLPFETGDGEEEEAEDE